VIVDKLNEADQALTNLPEGGEIVDSAVASARSAINAARAAALKQMAESTDEK